MAIYVFNKNDSVEKVKLYLHKTGKGMFYFSKKKEGALDDVPEGRKVMYMKSGYPYLGSSD